ncbi:MAG: nucleotidyltransferase domain-containing protein [Candidatus Cloacimonetes bacterium]|nr:nucleotidyltransferase domain-containing protein [Candidatus Cloacimonadota bacterium]
MRLKFYPQEKLAQEIIKIVAKYLPLNDYKVFFFGSRVSGKGDERSDIDVGIEGKAKTPIETILKIKEELAALPTLYSIDVVDFRRADDNFRKVAKKTLKRSHLFRS